MATDNETIAVTVLEKGQSPCAHYFLGSFHNMSGDLFLVTRNPSGQVLAHGVVLCARQCDATTGKLKSVPVCGYAEMTPEGIHGFLNANSTTGMSDPRARFTAPNGEEFRRCRQKDAADFIEQCEYVILTHRFM